MKICTPMALATLAILLTSCAAPPARRRHSTKPITPRWLLILWMARRARCSNPLPPSEKKTMPFWRKP